MSDALQTKVTVTAGDLPQLIVACRKAGRPLMIHGSPGIGKSAAIHAAVKQLAGKRRVALLGEFEDPDNEFGLIDQRLTNMGPEEFGLPVADKVTGVQRRLPVDWFPSTTRTDLPDEGILLFEEVVSAVQAVQAGTFQITHDGRLGDKSIKPGWSIVLTGNLMTDGGVVHKMPTPLANRMMHVYVVSDVDSWTDWALGHGISDELVAFIRFRPELLNTFNNHVKEKSKDHAFATERTWHVVDDLIKADANPHPALIAGAVGQGPATEFGAFRKTWSSMPSIDGILMDPAKAPVPGGAAVRYAVSTALASRATRDNFADVCQYIERLPAEFAVLTVKDCMRRHGGEITSTSAFLKAAQHYREFLN
jgi:hypothetical protein